MMVAPHHSFEIQRNLSGHLLGYIIGLSARTSDTESNPGYVQLPGNVFHILIEYPNSAVHYGLPSPPSLLPHPTTPIQVADGWSSFFGKYPEFPLSAQIDKKTLVNA